jgi:putative ABC transport system permease protein
MLLLRRQKLFKNYIKVAARNLRKYKTYSFINIFGLAIGMAVCLLILLFVRDELSYDRYHENSDRIYRLITEFSIKEKDTLEAITSPPMGPALAADFPEVLSITRFYRAFDQEVLIRFQEKMFYENLIFFADQSVFDIFTFPLAKGNPRAALEEPYSVVITEEMAEKYFGHEDPLGKTLTFNNKDDYKITGVMKKIPSNSHFRFDFLASFSTLNHFQSIPLDDWGSCALYTYLLLAKGYSPQDLEKKLPSFLKKYASQITFLKSLYVQPLTDIHLHSNLLNEIEPNSDMAYIYIFSAVAFIILLIACINFVNLSTAKHANRAKEVGMRKVLGAYRNQIVRQYLGESVFLTFAALPLSLLLVELFLPVFNKLVGKNISVGFIDNLYFLLAVIGFTIFVGVVSGIYPALFLSSFQPIKVLRGFRSGSARQLIRSALVLAQFALSIILITCTVVISNQLRYIQNKKLGFDREHVVVIPLKEKQILLKSQSLKNELLRNPNILRISVASDVPGRSGVNSNRFIPEGFEATGGLFIKNMRVDYDFLETLGVEIKEGRNFSKDFETDISEAFILNEAAVERIGWDQPIGKKLEWHAGRDRSKKGTVIGIIKDFHYESLNRKIEPLVLHIWPPSFQYCLIRIRPGDIQGTLDFIQQRWKELAPDFPFIYSFLDEDFGRLYKSEQKLSRIFACFSAFSIFVACLGLFGLALFAAEQRTKEIGIRKVLGASAARIALLLSREFTKWVLLANVIAWPVAYFAMSRWLQNFAYRINFGIGIFLLSALIAFVVALATVSYQAIKAALANPVEALRYE